MHKMKHASIFLVIMVFSAVFALANPAAACTGISLKGGDDTIVAARTCEWGAFDFGSQVLIVPRDYKVVCRTPDGKPGMKYSTKYGVVGMDVEGEFGIADGINEKGMTVGAFYLPGFAEYQKYDPAQSAKTMGPHEVMLYLLSQFQSIDEVREGLKRIVVAPVEMEAFGFPPPFHYFVVEPSGRAIVVEYVDGGKLKIYDATLGVITNSPTYDWHLLNLRNYLGLTKEGQPARKLEGQSFGPFGAGSGMLGLPGDTTPPSRFVQAVAFTQTARNTKGGLDTVNEVFRILDHFNIMASGAEGADIDASQDLPSATQWTTAIDTKNRIFYYHTAWNRRVRMVDLKKIDFSKVKMQRIPLDKDRVQDVEEIMVK